MILLNDNYCFREDLLFYLKMMPAGDRLYAISSLNQLTILLYGNNIIDIRILPKKSREVFERNKENIPSLGGCVCLGDFMYCTNLPSAKSGVVVNNNAIVHPKSKAASGVKKRVIFKIKEEIYSILLKGKMLNYIPIRKSKNTPKFKKEDYVIYDSFVYIEGREERCCFGTW